MGAGVGADEAVRGAFDWLAAVAVDAPGGALWSEKGVPTDDLYCGTAGVLLACAEAHRAGADVDRVAGPALARLQHVVAHPDAAELPEAAAAGPDGLFGGWAGVLVALRAWGEPAEQVSAGIARRVLDLPPHPRACTDVIDGDAGILVALVDDVDDPDVRAAVGALADRLVAVAEPHEGGLQWRMEPGYPILMPGFSHGTAGVGYALVLAARALDRPDLLAVAVRGAESELALGDRPDGWRLPMTVPRQEHRPEVSFGWCHGPAGTLRFFALLDQVDPDLRWHAAVDRCVRALRDSRLPERLHPGYWDNVGRCCGTAGVGRSLLDRYDATGDVAYLDWAGVLADDVLARTVETPDGLTWSNTEHTADPPELPPEPGLMQGAAGVAGWLARLQASRSAGPAGAATTPWL